MNKKMEYLQEIHDFQFKSQNSIGTSHLELITNTLFKLVNSLYDYKVDIPYHMIELEGKCFRFGLANQSLLIMLKGNDFKLMDTNVVIPDIFSLKTLSRMQIESFLIMFYLFFENVDVEVKDFRYDIYKIHALNKQLNFEITNDTIEIREYQQLIKNELNQSIENLQKSSLYKHASERDKKIYLNPDKAKLIGTKQIFKSSDISDIKQIWELFSNYSHAEHISDRQFNKIYKMEKSFTKDINFILMINLVLTSKLIENILKNFNCAKKEFQNLSEKEKILIEAWSNLFTP